MTNIIDEFEKKGMKSNLPSVSVGDTVSIAKEIVEGKKKRIQKFQGIVIKMGGQKSKKSVTIRKISDKIGVEKSFLLHSPTVKDVEVKSKGKVRRAKLYYLRDRIGKKATRVKTAE